MIPDSIRKHRAVNILQEFSVPLVLGVFVALIFANANYDLYHKIIDTPLTEFGSIFESHEAEEVTEAAEGGESEDAASYEEADHGYGHYLTLHFLVNDIFMVVFFGIAAKEITESCLPGGSLNPISKAINPLFGTLGGVLGPIGCYLAFNTWFGQPEWAKGWGIPTATDIALAWLVARIVFGIGHPAVSFLLLLAVADDAIGLGIIAIAYPDPEHPTFWLKTVWIIPGMIVAYFLRRKGVQSWWPYIIFGGAFSWYGLFAAHMHPALALVFIVPFLPGPKKDIGMFEEEPDYEEIERAADIPSTPRHEHAHAPLERFEHDMKIFVDFGLFFFAFVNAGVAMSEINNLTWIVLASLIVGKTVGITLFSWAGTLIGFPMPTGMRMKHLVMAGLVAGLGLTVALFVAGQAFVGPAQGAAKMGALFSGGVAILAIALSRIMRVDDRPGMDEK